MHYAKLISHLNNKTHITRCEQAIRFIKLRYCFIIPTMLAHHFTRVEQEGDWILQQHCLERMLPYLCSWPSPLCSLHQLASIRDMQHIPPDAKQDLLNGSHICRHIDRAAAVSGDQYGEQTGLYHTGGNKPRD